MHSGLPIIARASECDFVLELGLRFGPLRLAFYGRVHIERSDPPHGYLLVGRGAGGPAGRASGTAEITLAERAGGCVLNYAIEADMRGRLSLIGPIVLSNIGKAFTASFTARFKTLVDRRPVRGYAPA